MKNKWFKILLIASLAFNLAFAATMIFRKTASQETRPPRNRFQGREWPGKNDIKLRDQQKKEIREIFRSNRRRLMEHKQNIMDKRIEIIEALSDAEFDPEEIKKKTAELNQVEDQLNLLFVDALIEVNHILDDGQRLNFLLRLSRNWFFIKESKTHRGNKRRRR
jgi:Spy/CpxP family protein refolding chaperone